MRRFHITFQEQFPFALLVATVPFGIADEQQPFAFPLDQQNDAGVVADLAVEIGEGERGGQHARAQLAEIGRIQIRLGSERHRFRHRRRQVRQAGVDESQTLRSEGSPGSPR